MSTKIDAVDCQGLGGGMTLGFVQAGVNLVRKVEQQGSDIFFNTVDANRALVGKKWDGGCATPDEWEPADVPLVFGNPPCSGFSMMSVRAGRRGGGRGGFRGIDASINSCMWDLVNYAARCAAETVVMESVTSAGAVTGSAAGRPLMQALRTHMEELTGRPYFLTHCFHNGLRLGGSSERRRYFMVLSRRPFSVSVPAIDRIPTLADVIGDLPWSGDPGIPLAYATDPTWWSKSKRNRDGYVDGCATWFDLFESDHGGRLHDAIGTGDWQQGEHLGQVLQRYYERTGGFPGPAWTQRAQDAILYRPLEKAKDYTAAKGDPEKEAAYCVKWQVTPFPPSCPEPWQGGAYMPKRWRSGHHAHVMAGNALTDIVHPTADRTFTFREAARVMGFPDAWRVEPYYANRNASMVFGKGVLVESGRWIGQAAVAHLSGDTLEDSGELVGEREYLVDHKNLARELYAQTFRRK